MTAEEAAVYWIVSFLPACIACFLYPWKLSYTIALGAKGAEAFAVHQSFDIIGQSGFGQSWNQLEKQNAFYFH